MTGNCFTDRAHRLINKCAPKLVRCYSIDGNNSIFGENNASNIYRRLYQHEYWSPIEVFIGKEENQTNGNNKMLISFLKGNRKTLRFK